MKKTAIILTSTVALIILSGCIIYTIVLPAFITGGFFQEKLKTEILRKTGFELFVDNLTVKTTHKGLKITASNVFADNYYTNEFIKLSNLDTNISLLALMGGNIELNNTFISRLKIRLENDYSELLLNPKIFLAAGRKGLNMQSNKFNKI